MPGQCAALHRRAREGVQGRGRHGDPRRAPVRAARTKGPARHRGVRRGRHRPAGGARGEGHRARPPRHHRRVPLRVHDHGHCGVVEDGERAERSRRSSCSRARRLARRGRRRHGGAVRHDGRARGRDPRGARRGELSGDADHGLLGEVRLGVLRAVPRGGGLRAPVRRPARLPDGPRQRRWRPCARSRSTSTRAPTSSW